MSNFTCSSRKNIQILFNILAKRAKSTQRMFSWLTTIIDELSKANSCDLGANEMRRIIEFLKNSSAIGMQKMKDALDKKYPAKGSTDAEIENFKNEYEKDLVERFLFYQDKNKNNVLMILAKHIRDGALREMLTNDNTVEHITHTLLAIRNDLNQTLTSILEVNREDMPESLALVLKVEYACHAGDLTQAEICLSGQMETSTSSFEIIKGLHQLQPLTWCQKFNIWIVLFFTWLIPNYWLTGFDWFSDGYLTWAYYQEWNNTDSNLTETCNDSKNKLEKRWNLTLQTFGTNMSVCGATIDTTTQHYNTTHNYTTTNNITVDGYNSTDPMKAYKDCIGGEIKFWYTLIPMVGPVLLYMIEFFVLTDDYEPTGLRVRIRTTWKRMKLTKDCLKYFTLCLRLFQWVVLVVPAIIFWMPVSAWCKFVADGKYQTCRGMEKVRLRRNKRCMDLAASRGELMEVSIEDVFEPMIQGYIIFPSMISIVQRMGESVDTSKKNKITFGFTLDTVELGQMFSIVISMISLAWCYSEYHSVRKNMYLDPSESPFSRIIMWLFMLCQIMARLFAFMLFTLYWGPGQFYPLMIFILIHLILAGALHIIFSDDLLYCRKGKWIKFFHNVTFNALSSIYFHNYIHQDENSDIKAKQAYEGSKKEQGKRSETGDNSSQDITSKTGHVDQSCGLHTSTLLRQLMFDLLYTVEFVVLLSFGLHSRPFLDASTKLYCSNLYIILAIVILMLVALSLRLVYYSVMHVWSNVIWESKKLHRKELTDKTPDIVDNPIDKLTIEGRKEFFKYVFVCRNTWLLGDLKNIEVTLAVLPKWIIENIREYWQHLVIHSEKKLDEVRIWFATFTWKCPQLFFKILHIFISVLLFIVLFFVLNIVIIGLLLVLLALSFPVLVILFVFNLRKGFKATEDSGLTEIIDTPPNINQEELFKAYPEITLFYIQQGLKNKNGLLDLANRELIEAEEVQPLSLKVLSLDSKQFPLKILDLTNCCVTDKEMVHLAPLMAKFEKVILNGTQTLTWEGWNTLRNVIFRMSVIPKSVKLQALELKVKKRKKDVIKEGRKYLGERGDEMMDFLQQGNDKNIIESKSEFDGKAMDGESLKAIAEFLPRLEEVHLDNVFREMSIFSQLKNKAVDKAVAMKLPKIKETKLENPWSTVKEQILRNPSKRKLKRLSINGCQINDSTLDILAPALVQIEKLHLAENPDIKETGWQKLEDRLTDDTPLKFISLKICTPENKYLISKETNLLQLAKLLSKMEEIDISGQKKEIIRDLIKILDDMSVSAANTFKLKSIILSKSDHELTKTTTESLKHFYSFFEEKESVTIKYSEENNPKSFVEMSVIAVAQDEDSNTICHNTTPEQMV